MSSDFPSCRRTTGLGAVLLLLLMPAATAQFAGPQTVNLGIGINPQNITGIISEDLDGDGLSDIVGVDDANTGQIGLALGTAGGAYNVQAPVIDPSGSSTGAFLPVLADFDLDGNLDLAYAGTTPTVSPTHAAIYVLLGTPVGANYTFTPTSTHQIIALPGSITSLTTTDFDGDGNQDLMYTTNSPLGASNTVGMLPNVGGGIFGSLHSSTTATGAAEIDICVDYNDDGRKDLVICRPAGAVNGAVDLYAGLPAAPFIPASPTVTIPLPVGFDPIDVHWIECDQKNGYDLALALNGTNSGVVFIRNLGVAPFFNTGGIQPAVMVTGLPSALRRLEVNFDGQEDLSVYSLQGGPGSVKPTDFEVLRVIDCVGTSIGVTNTGGYNSIAFAEQEASLLAVADQRGDGLEDLLVVDHTPIADAVLVYTNIANVIYTISPTRPLLGEVTTFRFNIQTSPALSGRLVACLFSFNGTLPGTAVGPFTLPLNLPLQPNILFSSIGPGGDGSFSQGPIAIPPAPTLFSAQLASACMVQGPVPGTIALISNPAVITLP